VRGTVFGQPPDQDRDSLTHERSKSWRSAGIEALMRRAKPAADILQAKGHELRALSYTEAVRRSMYESTKST